MSRPRTALRAALVLSGVVAAAVGVAPPALADITRCVGAVQTPGAFACYTSPRTDHIGLDSTAVMTMPVVCYGIGCTSSQLLVYTPDGDVNGRFTAVSYLGHTYTVYRPTGAQPYILLSDNALLTPAEEVEVLALSTSLDAAGM